LLQHFALWFVIPAALYYLLSLYGLFRYHEAITYAWDPGGTVWNKALFHCTIHYPSLLCDPWPVSPSRLAIAMIVQSLFFGMLVVLFWRTFFTFSWTKPARIIIRIGLSLVLLFITIGLFDLGMFLLSLFIGRSHIFHVSSASLPPHTIKSRWLSHCLKVPGPILDTEFDIRKSFGGFYYPASVSADVMIKVPPQDVTKWLAGQTQYNLTPDKKPGFLKHDYPLFIKNAARRQTTVPEYYNGDNVSAIVYRREGIILFTISNHGWQ